MAEVIQNLCIFCDPDVRDPADYEIEEGEYVTSMMAAFLSEKMKLKEVQAYMTVSNIGTCLEHMYTPYKMMVNVIGASTANEVKSAIPGRLSKAFAVYRNLQTRRNEFLGKARQEITKLEFNQSLIAFFQANQLENPNLGTTKESLESDDPASDNPLPNESLVESRNQASSPDPQDNEIDYDDVPEAKYSEQYNNTDDDMEQKPEAFLAEHMQSPPRLCYLDSYGVAYDQYDNRMHDSYRREVARKRQADPNVEQKPYADFSKYERKPKTQAEQREIKYGLYLKGMIDEKGNPTGPPEEGLTFYYDQPEKKNDDASKPPKKVLILHLKSRPEFNKRSNSDREGSKNESKHGQQEEPDSSNESEKIKRIKLVSSDSTKS